VNDETRRGEIGEIGEIDDDARVADEIRWRFEGDRFQGGREFKYAAIS
jgi:hypothetical protein